MIKRYTALPLLILSLAAALPSPSVAGAAAREGVDLSKPREAGIRYGQAAGVAAVCPNMRTTDKAEALVGTFSGSELDVFIVQAEAVLKSWRKTLTCAHSADPNPCRLANQLSCREAYGEIGPEGRVAPGLVEMTSAN